jgi:hypothetical protein
MIYSVHITFHKNLLNYSKLLKQTHTHALAYHNP